MTAENREITVTSSHMTELISRAVVKGAAPTVVLLGAAIVQSFRNGFSLRYTALAAGALLSAILLVAYAGVTKANLESPLPRGWIPMLLTFGGLFPYIFGCYLFFYEGLWRLSQLRHGVSASVIALAVAFIIGGYWLVSATHQVSELAKFRKVSAATENAV